MALIVDDILALPGTIGGIIFDTIAQTVEKVAWAEYSRGLKRMLLRARHDYDTGKISRENLREVERYVFKEMGLAKRALTSKRG